MVENRTSNTNSVTIALNRGVAYYWAVTAMDAEDSANASVTQAFYTKGNGEANSVPFSASLVTPTMDSAVDAGMIALSWTGGDADTSDTLTYDVFVSDSVTTLTSVATGISESTFNQSVSSGDTVFWRVDTSDNSGAKSIGQVWSFTVN